MPCVSAATRNGPLAQMALIADSKGHFDEADYERQLNGGR